MATKKVNNYEICKTFKEWLAKNGHRFNHKFKVRHYKKRGILRLYFEDVTPEIHCSVNERIGVVVSVYFRRKFWDYLVDLDCAIRRAKSRKYYCGFCEEPKYYKTPQDLLIDHSFETFLEWVNDNITSSHVLELRESAGGSTEAIIIDTRLPDSIYTRRRAAFGNLLKGLKRLPDESPRASKNSDDMKITVIPIIKGEGFHDEAGMGEDADKTAKSPAEGE